MGKKYSATDDNSNRKRSPARRVPSKIFRNPFLNFMRDFRRSDKQNLTVTELIRRGAQIWRQMSEKDRAHYIAMSKNAPKTTVARRRRRRRKGSRSRSRTKRHRSRSSPKQCELSDEVNRLAEDSEKATNEEQVKSSKSDEKNIDKEGGSRLRLKTSDYDGLRRDYI
ncbi:uncharacterized protein LOC126884556 [Diabrotica virgifera virgifera]|uniref:HMG box domain-containing protein n=1 Tax=Diabrotica virgifera virgifera TaxID=50390 RepID=A0ABM5K8F8_DIAVI|nr:uncharacterized protein LOC126884556 [Diabrotica virgifera virgifera]